MPFTPEKLDQIKVGINNRLASSRLNDWERRFLSDMQAKLAKHGTNTSLTDKQYQTLMKLAYVRPHLVASNGDTSSQKPSRQVVTTRRATLLPRLPSPIRTPRILPRPPKLFRRGRRGLRQVQYAIISVMVLFGLIASIGAGPPPTSSNAPASTYSKSITPSEIRIIDGDTINVSGERRNVRLVGFDTPETYRPSCQRELEAGQQATRRLGELINQAATLEFERVPCACRPGTEGTDKCNFGRICGTLRTDGRDVGQTLMSEGLAVRFKCAATSCPRSTANWCQ